MSDNSGKIWVYLLVLGGLFGLVYLLRFVIPHYEPGDYSEESSDGPTIEEILAEKSAEETETPPFQEEVSDSLPQTEAEEPVEEASTVTSTPIEQPASPAFEDNSQTVAFFDDLIQDYRMNVLNQLPAGKPRSDVIIRYYVHRPDGQKVYKLRDLGFYIHERPVEQEMANYESNAIYYGDNVSREDLLIVGSTLIRQGLPIKSIKPSLYHDGWKSNAIEIGADSTIINLQPLTLQELRNLQFDFL